MRQGKKMRHFLLTCVEQLRKNTALEVEYQNSGESPLMFSPSVAGLVRVSQAQRRKHESSMPLQSIHSTSLQESEVFSEAVNFLSLLHIRSRRTPRSVYRFFPKQQTPVMGGG